jgi:hypothetical protein
MAVEPSNIKQIEYNGQSMQVVQMDILPDYDKEDYNLSDNKEREKYFKDIEKIVRGSFEYRTLVSYLREYMNMNKCSFFENVNNMESFDIKIHLHHSPITLYEIVITIFNKRLFYHEPVDAENVAKEAAYVHYCLLVGLIPLCETVHELVHAEYLFIPNDAVLGNYNDFIEMYKNWIPPEVKDKLDRIEKYSLTYNEEENKNILRTSYIYLDFSGAYKLPKLEDVMKLMSDKMGQIKSNNFSNSTPMVRFYDGNGNIIG